MNSRFLYVLFAFYPFAASLVAEVNEANADALKERIVAHIRIVAPIGRSVW